MSSNVIGGVMSTIIKLYGPDGEVHEIEVASAEAVLRLLRSPVVRKLRDGEPFFLLRGQDDTAPATVEFWRNRNYATLPMEKMVDSGAIADAMRHWPLRRTPT